MKTLNKISILFVTILFSMAILSSCQKEENLNPVHSSDSSELVQQVKTKQSSSTKSACDENLIQDAGQCSYISGEGVDMVNRFDMVTMLDNCHQEPLPNGCEWSNSNLVTEVIYGYLNNCCSPFNSLNYKMNAWKSSAESSRPSNNYKIVGYQAGGGIMLNGGYGPYKFYITVTYRKHKTCLNKYEPVRTK